MFKKIAMARRAKKAEVKIHDLMFTIKWSDEIVADINNNPVLYADDVNMMKYRDECAEGHREAIKELEEVMNYIYYGK